MKEYRVTTYRNDTDAITTYPKAPSGIFKGYTYCSLPPGAIPGRSRLCIVYRSYILLYIYIYICLGKWNKKLSFLYFFQDVLASCCAITLSESLPTNLHTCAHLQ